MVEKGDKVIYTKNDIALRLSERLGITKSESTTSVNEMFEILGEMLKELKVGDEIKLGNIGVLTTRMSKAGDRRNPKTQEIVHVESKRVAKFRVLPKFRAELNSKE